MINNRETHSTVPWWQDLLSLHRPEPEGALAYCHWAHRLCWRLEKEGEGTVFVLILRFSGFVPSKCICNNGGRPIDILVWCFYVKVVLSPA